MKMGLSDVIYFLINIPDELKRTHLPNAVIENDLQKVKHLVQKGANTEAKDNEGNTPLEVSMNRGLSDVKFFFD